MKFSLRSLGLLLLLSLLALYFIKDKINLASSQPPPLNPLSLAPSPLLATPTPTIIPTAQIGLVGDLGLGRHITSTARQKQDFGWSFSQISPWLKSNDFNLANLESPIIDQCPEGKTGTFTFCGDIRFLPYLKENRLIFNLANNHIFNYGQDGFGQTDQYLSQNSLTHFYSHTPNLRFAIREVNQIKFGFLGYDFITNPQADTSDIIEQVKTYNSQVDWLIVSIHWGNEYLASPEKWRIELAHQLIDAGADIIHGHHPHVWQDPEIYQNKPIFYSFGNFIFDQSWSYETSHSQIVRLTLTKDQILKTELFPIAIDYNSQPRILAD
jgi:poly-gamma-glutamate capsule biosynthesis protein CapA/YwtB (metallophosphatase superfamily)